MMLTSSKVALWLGAARCCCTGLPRFPMIRMGDGETLCGLELPDVGVVALLLQRPNVYTLLHPQPQPRAIAQQLAQADRHVRRNGAAFVQDFGHGAARHTQPVGKLALCDPQLGQCILTQDSAGVRGFAVLVS